MGVLLVEIVRLDPFGFRVLLGIEGPKNKVAELVL